MRLWLLLIVEVFTVITPLLLPGPARADGFRCGTSVVKTGDSDQEVIAKCGEPQSRAPWLETRCSRWGHCQTLQVGERWTYDLGPDRFVRRLRFRDQRLESIEQGEYGQSR